ncbi:hypothetical protein [Chitinophaga eiseniae]|uniref:SH3 domain-containing protein n=1 Tax=Chitinophaga eiseniae TaxID=634771 RepID=A0A847SNT0_9BACT|nr:hypothetical protein [Chitinophaga eiseniae]NLR80547.1 hypothetical protein [Chitinophaga eiseniae]
MKTMFFFCFVCILSFLTCTVFAQEETDGRTWGLFADQSRYIYGDTAFVRASADTRQAPIDTLYTGDEIAITDITDKVLNLRGMKLPWIKIKYKKEGQDKEGFLWQGIISLAPMRRGELKLVAGMERRVDTILVYDDGSKNPGKQFLVKIKAVQGGKVIATNSFRMMDDEAANFAEPKVMSGLGLSNVQYIMVLSFGGEACGIPTNYHYFAWLNDGRLVALPERMCVGDAGAYYHDESFIFPVEKGGEPDTIIWHVEEEEATDKDDKDGNPVMKTNINVSSKYAWDGVNGTFKKIGKWRS